MKRRASDIALLLTLLLMLAGCHKRPGMVLPQERLARIIADMELADAYATDQRLTSVGSDSMRLNLRRSILSKHGVNEATLDSSLSWYGRNLPEYLKMLERADSILADSLRALELEEQTALATAAGDTIDLWPHAPSVVFARNQPSDFVVFELPIDSTWQRGDVVTLTFALHNAQSSISAALNVDYANRAETTDGITTISFPGDAAKASVKLQLDSTITARRVYGYLHMSPKEGERAFADSIRLVRTRMVSKDYNHLRRLQRRIRRHDY